MGEIVMKKEKDDKEGGMIFRELCKSIAEMVEQAQQEAFMEGYNYAIQLLQDSVKEKTK